MKFITDLKNGPTEPGTRPKLARFEEERLREWEIKQARLRARQPSKGFSRR